MMDDDKIKSAVTPILNEAYGRGRIAGLKEAAEIAWQLHCSDKKDSAYAVRDAITRAISEMEEAGK